MEQTSRRRFITTVAALAGTTLVPNIINAKQGTDNSGTWDLSWLEKLKGKHKQMFDLQDMESLRTVRNWHDAYMEVFGIGPPDINAVVGIAGKGFPINAGDKLYQKFPIGEHWKVIDPETQKPAMHNIFLDGGKTPADQQKTVRALQARGVTFWQCNKALHRVSKDLADLVNRPEAEVYDELKAGLNPGVIVVPAHAMLIGMAQEHGFAYELV